MGGVWGELGPASGSRVSHPRGEVSFEPIFSLVLWHLRAKCHQFAPPSS